MWPRRPPRAAVAVVVVAALAAPAAGLLPSPPPSPAASHAPWAAGTAPSTATVGTAPSATTAASHAPWAAGTAPSTATVGAARAATATDGVVPSPAVGGARATTAADGARTVDRQRPDPAVVVRVNLTAEGDARWTVSSRLSLEGETDRAAFRALVADLRNGTEPEPPVSYSPATFRTLVDRVERATGRSGMAVVDPRWHGEIRNDTGIVSLSFTWTDFARTDGDRVLLGDVFRADVGWFSSLADDQRMLIAPPPGYAVIDSPFPVDERVIRIDGPEDIPASMNTSEVSVVYAPTAGTVTPTPTASTTVQDPFPVGLLGGGVLVLVVAVLGVVYLLYGRRDSPDGGPPPGSTPDEGDTGGGPGPGPDADAGTGDEPTPNVPHGDGTGNGAVQGTGEPTAGPGDGTGPTPTDAADATEAGTTAGETTTANDPEDGRETGAVTGTGDGPGTDGSEAVDEELLSDEERVERLLAENGGRMKQATIVSETGWSSAKVSQLLSSMDEADRIDKLRIGRENLISLPDESVVDSPDPGEDPDGGSGADDADPGTG